MSNQKKKWLAKGIGLVFGSLFLAGTANKIIHSFNAPPTIRLEQIEAMYAQKQYPEALKAIDLFQQQPDNNIKAALIESNIYRQLKQPTQALAALETEIQKKPDSQLYEQQALIYSDQGKSAEAESALKQAIKYDPRNVFALNNLAVLYINKNQAPEAENYLRQAIQAAPSYPDAYRNLGFLHLQTKNTPEAKKNLEFYLKLQPQAPDAAEIRKLIG